MTGWEVLLDFNFVLDFGLALACLRPLATLESDKGVQCERRLTIWIWMSRHRRENAKNASQIEGASLFGRRGVLS